MLKSIVAAVLFCTGESSPTSNAQPFTLSTVITVTADRSLMVLTGTAYPLTKVKDNLYQFGRPEIISDKTFSIYTAGTIEVVSDGIQLVYNAHAITDKNPVGRATTARLFCRDWHGE